jgi:CubicO group peptidase (beta-lactamase class C family)
MPKHAPSPAALPRLLALALPLAGAAHAQLPDNKAAAALQGYFSQCHAVHVCNGSVLVARDGKVIYAAAFGDAGAGDQGPLTTAHAFDIGSISKQFTAAAVLRLADRGQLRLDDAVADHLPGFPYPRMTLRQLLTHTSGVPDVMGHYTQLLRSGKVATPLMGEDAVQVLAASGTAPTSAPGERFEYSNTGYLLLSQVVAQASGLPFASFLQREFFDPLGMRHTHVRMPGNEAAIAPRAYGFTTASDGQRRTQDQFPEFFMLGAGGIYSTTDDLLRWSKALRDGTAMSATGWREATTPLRLNDGSSLPYGFGLSLRTSPLQQPRIEHGGHWRAFKADLARYPAQDVDLVLLTNNGEDDSVDAARDAVEAILAGKPFSPVREPIDWPLRERLRHDDADALRRWLDAQRTATPARYDIPEDKLNDIGYGLIEAKQIDKAVAVLRFNQQTHPASMNALDSLADAYLAAGDRAAAIAQAKRMLVLKPDSRAAQEKLKALSEGK